VVEGVWKTELRKNASSKALESCYGSLGRLHSMERKNLPFVKDRKKGSPGIH